VPFRIVCARIGLGAWTQNVAWKIEAGGGVILGDDAVRTRQEKNVTQSGKIIFTTVVFILTSLGVSKVYSKPGAVKQDFSAISLGLGIHH